MAVKMMFHTLRRTALAYPTVSLFNRELPHVQRSTAQIYGQ